MIPTLAETVRHALEVHARLRGHLDYSEEEAKENAELFPEDVARLALWSGCDDPIALAWLWMDAGETASFAEWLDFGDSPALVESEIRQAVGIWETRR
jgi:hypothetical protein